MLTHRKNSIATAVRAAAPIAAVALAIAALLLFPPERSRLYPQCPIFGLFHLQCPGCGATRALAALLHGRLREARHHNALITVTLPFAVLWAGRSYSRFLERKPFRWPRPSQPAIYAGLVITAGFTIARNL